MLPVPFVTKPKTPTNALAKQIIIVNPTKCTHTSYTTQTVTSTSSPIRSSCDCYTETAGLIATSLIMIISLLGNVIIAMILYRESFKFEARYA